ncbi:phage late control D family protein [uncultured Succinivibrio sp.]|uniref:phage late control D family protein n=1 Tax=uncultured Succinivibrio sp. TaxID=540749 RepID=UPI0025D0FF36|nr:contractile injection system protein, VgrG/Pvc8 family [uncultured Succinivibrio sp.]
METIANVLKTVAKVFYEQTEITQDVYADLLQVSYTDKAEDEADEMTVTLKDETGKWAGSWSPERGASVRMVIATESRGALETGKMMIDSLRTSGSPRVFEFSAVSIPLDNTIRRTQKNRSFETATLQTIAGQIASESNLEFFWDCEDDPKYDRTEQKSESDLAFLQRLCKDAGLSVKVSAEKLVIFDQKSYENKTPVKTFVLGESPILSWSFQSQQSQRYRSCTVTWRNIKAKTRTSAVANNNQSATADLYKGDNPKKGTQSTKTEDNEYTYVDESVEESGQCYILKKRATSSAEAERMAKAKLRELNLRQTTGSLSVIGDPILCAGSVIKLLGFGSFDGNFIIESANHSISNSGYTTSVDLRRVNEKY